MPQEPVAPAPWEQRAQRPGGRNALAIAGIACVAAAVLLMSLFVIGHQTPSAQSGNPLFVAGAPTQGPSTGANASSTPAPAAGADAATVAQAGQAYLAAVAPVNSGFGRFYAALDNPSQCTCPQGEVSITAALVQIPALQRSLTAFEVVLRQIEAQLPADHADIDAALADDQAEYIDLAHCIDANNAGDANALGRDVVQVGDDQDASRHDFERLRADLGLPPPPGATAQAQPAATLPAV